MKKISTALFITALSFAASSALASESSSKTEGNYFGAEVIRTAVRFHEVGTRDTFTAPLTYPHFSDHGYGAGLSYKHAFNFDGVFVAPGIFFEQNNVEVGGKGATPGSHGGELNRLRINNRYGVKADVGYDVTDKIAPYVTGGYSRVSYVSKNAGYRSGVTTSDNKSSTLGDLFYGVGVKFKYSNNISFGLEYNTQKFVAKTVVSNDARNYNGVYKTNLSVLKLGVLYNF